MGALTYKDEDIEVEILAKKPSLTLVQRKRNS